MLLFELFASLGLDTTTFRQQADAAVEEGGDVAASVSESFSKVQEEAKAADTKLNDLETKSQTTTAIVDGLVQATGQIIEKGVEMLLEFGAASIEAAAGTGSALAEEFNNAKDQFDLTMDALKLKVGNTLLPIATGFYELAASMTGVTDSDRLLLMLERIEQYEFSNIEQLRADLGSIFSGFEQVGSVEAGNIADMTSGLESQAAYWEDYADTLENLRSRNIDPQFLQEFADGTVESLQTLKALEAADSSELAKLAEAYEAVEATKAATAESLREMQLSIDGDLLSMTQSVEELVAGMNQEEAARANTSATVQGAIDALSSMSSSVSSWVNHINSELSRIGEGYVAPSLFQQGLMQSFGTNEMGFSYWRPHASGNEYIPYDGYRAELHRGEAVLTRQQADEYRSNQTGGIDTRAIIAKLDDVVSAIAGMQFTVNNKTLGSITTSAASRGIANEARSERRYG